MLDETRVNICTALVRVPKTVDALISELTAIKGRHSDDSTLAVFADADEQVLMVHIVDSTVKKTLEHREKYDNDGHVHAPHDRLGEQTPEVEAMSMFTV